MDVNKLDWPNIGECQKIYNKYGINDSNHNITTTSMCAVIRELEKAESQLQALKSKIEKDDYDTRYTREYLLNLISNLEADH